MYDCKNKCQPFHFQVLCGEREVVGAACWGHSPWPRMSVRDGAATMATNAGGGGRGGGGGGGGGSAGPNDHDGRSYLLQIYPRLAAQSTTCCSLRWVWLSATSRSWSRIFMWLKSKGTTAKPTSVKLCHCFFPTHQSAEGRNRGLRNRGRCCGPRAGPRPHVCACRGEGMWRRGVGAGGWRPAGTEVFAVASESPGETSPKPRLLLPTTGRVDSTQCTLHRWEKPK